MAEVYWTTQVKPRAFSGNVRDMWVPVFSNGIKLGDGWAGKKF